MMFKKKISRFHLHQWEQVVYIYPHERHVVRYCHGCDGAESLVRDIRTNKEFWVKGDLWLRGDTVYVIADNEHMFQAFKREIMEGVQNQRVYRLTEIDQIRGLRNPIILFTGEWWDQEIVRDVRFTTYLNYNRI
jgi:hypothetical protein